MARMEPSVDYHEFQEPKDVLNEDAQMDVAPTAELAGTTEPGITMRKAVLSRLDDCIPQIVTAMLLLSLLAAVIEMNFETELDLSSPKCTQDVRAHCLSCQAFILNYSSPITPCLTVHAMLRACIAGLWGVVLMAVVQAQAIGSFDRRKQLMCTVLAVAFFTQCVVALSPQSSQSSRSLKSSTTIADSMSQGITLQVTLWILLFCCDFPSDRWLRSSQRIASFFGALFILSQLLSPSVKVQCWTSLAFVIAYSGIVVVAARVGAVWKGSSLRKVVHTVRNAASRGYNSEQGVGDMIRPGFMAVLANISVLFDMLLSSTQEALQSEAQEMSLAASCDGLDTTTKLYGMVHCAALIGRLVFITFAPALLLIELKTHGQYWDGSEQHLLVEKFERLSQRGVDWQEYQFKPSDWEITELLAAGSEGEVHLGKCMSPHMRSPQLHVGGTICVKCPHLEGQEALAAVLEETAVLIEILDRLKSGIDGSQYIVAIIGFCLDLPTVATILPFYESGDLLHRLDELHTELQLQVTRVSSTTLPSRYQTVGSCWGPNQGTSHRSTHQERNLERPSSHLGRSMGNATIVSLNRTILHASNPAQENLHIRLDWARQVAVALNALHEAGVAHMDVKTDNVLLTECTKTGQEKPRLIDFGRSALMDQPWDPVGENLCVVPANTGTPAFMAPELLNVHDLQLGDIQLTIDPFAADVYSYGFLLYECVTFCREPVCRQGPRSERELAQAPTLVPREMSGVWGTVPTEVERLTQRCFGKASERPKAREIAEALASIQLHMQ